MAPRSPAVELPPGTPSGRIQAPPSKSHAIRLLAAATLAHGPSVLRRAPTCDDFQAAVDICRALGAVVTRRGDVVQVVGRGGGRLGASVELDCGESALCLRLFTCVASALVPLGAQPRPTTVVARGSLNHRSLGGVEAALNELDVRPETRGGRPPVEIRGPLRAGSVTLDASDSSQGLSGLLVALPLLAGDSRLEVTELRSRSYARLTLDVLALAGVNCRTNTELTRVEVAGGQHYQPFNTTVEGDWSGAAFPLVAGAWAGPVTVAGLNPGSMQPDRAVVEALEAAGAQVSTVGGTVTVRAGRARAFSFDATDCPDLLPPLAALAASCPGTSELKGAQRLRRKESDRAEALRLELGKLGVPVVIRGDVLEVTGVPIRAGRVQAHGDHRIAMTLAIAALRADAPCELEGAQTVAKSYPEFFRHLEVLRGGAA